MPGSLSYLVTKQGDFAGVEIVKNGDKAFEHQLQKKHHMLLQGMKIDPLISKDQAYLEWVIPKAMYIILRVQPVYLHIFHTYIGHWSPL